MNRGATLGLAPALPGLVLVIVIFWALAAVLMLTGTLINAREIEDDVAIINNQTTPIDQDLDNVKLAAETNRIATRIKEAAVPLSGKLTETLAAARSIDKSAKEILATAGAINETAGSINGTVRQINGSVTSINNRVVSIHGTVNSIGGSVDSIHGTVRSIFGRVVNIFSTVGPAGATDRSIRGNVRRILRTFVALRPEVTSIDRGVSAINGRADRAATLVAGLHSDLTRVDTQVGVGHQSGGRFGIHGHANSIDCSPLINGLFGGAPGATGSYCNR
jgi:methyl-accepting chemotaxis protein